MYVLLEWILFVWLLVPFISSNFLGISFSFLKIWGKVDILPFPSKLSLYSPIWGWLLLCWIFIMTALYKAVTAEFILTLATIVIIVEVGYVLFYRSAATGGPEEKEMSLTHFGLWHNALTEEFVFRGLPLLTWFLLGIDDSAFWMYTYILGTSLLFGAYHWWRVHPIRFIDTTLFGILLAICVWNYGMIIAIFVHVFHNVLAVPSVHRSHQVMIWWRYRKYYLILLTVAVMISLIIAQALNIFGKV